MIKEDFIKLLDQKHPVASGRSRGRDDNPFGPSFDDDREAVESGEGRWLRSQKYVFELTV